jgi:hypothetical protein
MTLTQCTELGESNPQHRVRAQRPDIAVCCSAAPAGQPADLAQQVPASGISRHLHSAGSCPDHLNVTVVATLNSVLQHLADRATA